MFIANSIGILEIIKMASRGEYSSQIWLLNWPTHSLGLFGLHPKCAYVHPTKIWYKASHSYFKQNTSYAGVPCRLLPSGIELVKPSPLWLSLPFIFCLLPGTFVRSDLTFHRFRQTWGIEDSSKKSIGRVWKRKAASRGTVWALSRTLQRQVEGWTVRSDRKGCAVLHLDIVDLHFYIGVDISTS